MTNTVADTADPNTENVADVLEKLDNNVGLVIIVILAILFLLGTVANTTLLMAFFRRPTLRTTSNRCHCVNIKIFVNITIFYNITIYCRFILNLLVVNVFSTCLLLPLVSLDVVSSMADSPPAMPSLSSVAQCTLSETVSTWIASLSLLSTVLISCDQYLAVLHPLRYHHHITRVRASVAIITTWIASTIAAIVSAVDTEKCNLWLSCYATKSPEMLIQATIIFPMLSFLLMFLLPTLILTVIYAKIYWEAHNSSARTRRRSSLSPLDTLSSVVPTVTAPLMTDIVTVSDKLNKCSRQSSLCRPPNLPTGREGVRATKLKRSNTCATVYCSEHLLQKQNSVKLSPSSSQTRLRHNLTHIRHRISNASQFIYREEGKTAKLYIFIIFLVLICWLPFYCGTGLTSSLFPKNLLPTWTHPLTFILVLLFPVVSPYVFAYRNSKIKRELHRIFHIKNVNDTLPPLPRHSSRLCRSVSMKEPTKERKKELKELRKSFLLQLHKGDGREDKEAAPPLMLAPPAQSSPPASSPPSTTRSSFSSTSGRTQCSSLYEERLEVTC